MLEYGGYIIIRVNIRADFLEDVLN